MSTMATNNADSSKCAACGKGGDGLKTCNGCKLVKYCNATCQKEHRPQHKKECKKRAAELFDEDLFKKPPPNEECPICMLPLPLIPAEKTYFSCCGKIICLGCVYASLKQDKRGICPFCRAPAEKSDGEFVGRLKKRVWRPMVPMQCAT